MKQKHLFVSGCARSGTSALTMVLNRHPEIAIGMERYISHLFSVGTYTSDLFEEDRFFSILDTDTFYKSFDEVSFRIDRSGFRGATYVGDKVPRIFLYYDEIMKTLPAAKFLFIVRNPLSVAASFKFRSEDLNDKNWPRSRGVESAVADWNESLAKSLPLVNSGVALPLSYERLFFDGLGWEKMQNFLGISSPIPASKVDEPSYKLNNLTEDDVAYVVNNADWQSYSEILAKVFAGSDSDIYSASDINLIDYKSKRVAGISLAMRDPAPKDCICLGSAATFGRFVKNPFPKQLKASNFGIGGARPDSFLYEPGILSRVAQADTAIFEITSARGYGGAVFRPLNRFTNMVSVRPSYRSHKAFNDLAERVFIDRIWDKVFAEAEDLAQEMISYAQKRWVDEMKDLIRFARQPILLWFSQQDIPENTDKRSSYRFPHFVTASMLAELDAELIKVVSTAGIPFRLVNDEGIDVPLMVGWKDPCINSYYPSQEMHDLAYEALVNKI